MSTLRIGLNGLGRIGRLVLRHAVLRATSPKNSAVVRNGHELEFVAANDIAPIDQIAYLLNHDSVHSWSGPRAQVEGDEIHFGPLRVKVSAQREPAQIPWEDRNVDVVLECTGRFTKRADMSPHVRGGGPRRVIVGAPGEVDRTVVVGLNEGDVTDEDILLSNASCTTNAVSPVLAVLQRTFGIRWGILGTVHAYTAGQGLVDGGAKDWRRGRAAAQNIVPTSTGAGKAVSLVLPELAGKLGASAVRVPVPNGSMYDITCTLDESAELDRVLDALRDAAATKALTGVLQVSNEQLVSTDVIDNPHSSVVDEGACVAQGPLLKIAGWYDNEFAYAARLLDLAAHVGLPG